MDKTLRSILWILVGLVVLSSLSTAWFFFAKEKLYNEYTNLEELFKSTMDKLGTELASATKEKTELKLKLQAIEDRFNALEARHSGLKSDHEAAVSERDTLKKDLAGIKKAKSFLEKRLREMESDMFVANLLKQKVGLEVEIQRLKNDMEPKDKELSRLKADSADKDMKLAKLQGEKSAIEQKLKNSEQVAEIISIDLLKEKNLNQDVKALSEQIAMENSQLKSKISELAEIAKEYNSLLAEKEDLRAKIASLQSDLAYKNQEMRAETYRSPEEVELPPIRAQKVAKLTSPSLERAGETTAGLKGRVVTINKEHNFVVIDLGKQDGIDIGNRFNVYRGEMFLGSVEIIQARDRIAAADIKDIKDGMDIEINDTVVKR